MTSFGEILKHKRSSLGLSQKKFGELIGLKQSTIANYENGVRFPKGENLKKIAFHLKISIDEILLNNNNSPIDDLKDISFEEVQIRFVSALIEMNEDKALEIIKDFQHNWASVFVIYENIIKKSLYDIGVLWDLGRLSVVQEHFASQVCQKAISMLSYKLSIDNKANLSVICMTVNPEEHSLGIKIISETFKSMGITSYYIGSKVPTDHLIEALLVYKVRFLALSISMIEHIDSLINLIQVIRSESKLKDLVIVVGGRALENNFDLIIEKGADIYAKDSYELIKKINEVMNKIE